MCVSMGGMGGLHRGAPLVTYKYIFQLTSPQLYVGELRSSFIRTIYCVFARNLIQGSAIPRVGVVFLGKR